jgi:hypothetical protein
MLPPENRQDRGRYRRRRKPEITRLEEKEEKSALPCRARSRHLPWIGSSFAPQLPRNSLSAGRGSKQTVRLPRLTKISVVLANHG